MKKYTLTNIDHLKPGDQFIKENDPNEIVYTIMDMESHTNRFKYCKKGELMMNDKVQRNETLIYLGQKK